MLIPDLPSEVRLARTAPLLLIQVLASEDTLALCLSPLCVLRPTLTERSVAWPASACAPPHFHSSNALWMDAHTGKKSIWSKGSKHTFNPSLHHVELLVRSNAEGCDARLCARVVTFELSKKRLVLQPTDAKDHPTTNCSSLL